MDPTNVAATLAATASAAVAVSATVAQFLPPPTAAMPGWYPLVYAIVNKAAQNRGHAANASAPKL